MTMDLREKIAREYSLFDTAYGTPLDFADRILAIPEIAEALRLKPIKTMPVREK